jgi:hypothetical protein
MTLLKFQFSSSTAWQSRVIRKLCASPFSHVDLVLPDGNLLGASDSPTAPCISGNPRGVAVRPANYQLFDIRRELHIQTDKADAVIAKIMTQLGKPFDGDGIHHFLDDTVYTRNWRDPSSWFCSELDAWGCEDTYWEQELLWPKGRISPTGLFFLFMFDKNVVNREEFWSQIPGLTLGAGERFASF